MALIPFGALGVDIFGYQVDLVIANFDAGVIMFLAMGSIAVYGIVFAGWASNNHWSLLGGLRSGRPDDLLRALHGAGADRRDPHGQHAQLRRDRRQVSRATSGTGTSSRRSSAFVIFFVASIAELNRAPFDLAEAEQELVAGYMTEYSGMRWGLFMFGEYVNMVVMSAIIATLFLGGWRAPFTFLELHPRVHLAARQGAVLHLHVHVDPLDASSLPLQPTDGHRLEDLPAPGHRQPGRHGHHRERGD